MVEKGAADTRAPAVIADDASSGPSDDEVALAPPSAIDAGKQRRRRRQWLCGGAAILVVCGLAAVGILVARSRSRSLEIPDEFSGRFTAYSSDYGQEVLSGVMRKSEGPNGRSVVEGTSTFVEADTGLRIVFTYLNRRAYRAAYNDSASTTVPQSVTCLPEVRVPEMGDVGELFKQAAAVPASSLDGDNLSMFQCREAATERWSFRWGQQTFVYCQPSADAHVVASSNFHAVFVPDATTVDSLGLQVPVDPATGEAAVCPELKDVSALRMADGDEPVHHQGEPEVAAGRRLGSNGRRRLTPARPCVFVHGSGQASDKDATTSWTGYWGNIHTKLASQCSSFKFLKRNLKSRKWDHPDHAQAFCDAAANPGGDIGSVLIFSHGIGSLIVASALNNNICSFTSATRWYSAMAPFSGSKAADEGLNLCDNYDALKDILDYLKVCKGKDKDQLQSGILSSQTSYSSPVDTWAQLQAVANTHLDGAMCGHDSSGNYNGVGVGLVSIDDNIWFGEDRDGWMKLSQCKAAKNQWQYWHHNKWSTFVNMHLNYLDGACKWDDPLVDTQADHSPCAWFLRMAQRG